MTPPDAGRTTTTDELIAVPEAPPELRRRRMGLRAFLTYFGPGAIIASLTVGSGESILASREGAVFGYAILWAVVLGAVAKGALVYASNRYITVVGEHPMTRFARVFPGPRGWFAVLLAVICFLSFPGWASGLAVALGGYLEKLGAGNGLFWAIGLLLVSAAISFAGGYGLLEKTQIAIVAAMVVLVLVAVFVVNPSWGGVLGGFVPGGFDYAPWVSQKYPDIASTSKWIEVAVFMGGLGGGMYDYIGYTGLLREKRWGVLGHREIEAIGDRLTRLDQHAVLPLSDTDADRANVKAWSRAPFVDMLAAFVALTVIALAFMINGATILGADQVVPEGDDVLTHQSEFLAVVAPVFEYFYVIAIVMVLFGTMYALWEAYSWTAYESVSAVSDRVRRLGQRRVRPWVYGWTGLGAIAMILTGASFVALITPAAIVGGIIACGIYGAGLLYVDKVNLPDAYRMSPTLRTLVGVGSVFLFVCGVLALAAFAGVIG